METSQHTLKDLFAQLGLPSTAADIDRFVAGHAMPSGVTLADAPFWTRAQADFLREEVQEDADWAEVVDQLNEMLHAR
jgi:hypothetical protein